MKAVNASAPPSASEQPTAPVPPPSVLDPLKSIDVSTLDKLIAIRQEQERINGFRAKAKEKKTAVTDAVFKRVMDDYAARTTTLEQQSLPLREQARAEYRKLKTVVVELSRRGGQAKLEKDELEFRAAVGELTEAELAAKIRDPQGILAQCEADQKHTDTLKARFVEALGSEEALETEDEPPTREAQPVRSDEQPTGPAPASLRMAAAMVHAAHRAESRLASQNDTGDGAATVVVPRGAVRLAEQAAAAAAPPAPAPGASVDDEDESDNAETMMVALAAVVIIEPASASQEFQLGSINSIGRSDENQICLIHAGISRKHAVIKAIPGGFSIKDLGSQNGTFVNGQRVTEKALTDGDTIAVGSVRFVFRMPWTGAASATAGRAAARSAKR